MNVETAGSSESAFELIKQRKEAHNKLPDLLMVDYFLPQQTGIDLARTLYLDVDTKNIPIILASALRGLPSKINKEGTSIKKMIEKPILFKPLFLVFAELLGVDTGIQAAPDQAEILDQLQHLKILVVEDNQVNILVIKGMLKKFQISPDVAHNGKEALDSVINKKDHYDLVLMDCEMPIMDGLESTREIRRFEEQSDFHTLIIGLSAHAMDTHLKAAIDAGMDDYLTKPVGKVDLIGIFRKHF